MIAPDRATLGVPVTPTVAQSSLVLVLLDSRSPAGGHSHSGGMEPAINAGLITDLDDVRAFCVGRLHTSGRVAAAFAAAAASADPQWATLEAELDARTPSEAMRATSRTLGRGLRRLAEAMGLTIPPGVTHHPLVLGAACRSAGATPQLAARAAALGTCTAPASAAVRLLGIDPYAVHGMLAELAPRIDAVADDACTGELPAHSAPAMDLLADVHARSEVRLFAS